MSAAAWDIRHVDLGDSQPVVAANPRPLFVVFWWGVLPLGVRTYLSEQLPLGRSELTALTAEFAAAQLAARSAQFAGPARATYDGKPLLPVPVDRLQQCRDLLQQLDDFAEASPISAAPLSIIMSGGPGTPFVQRSHAAIFSRRRRKRDSPATVSSPCTEHASFRLR